MVMKQKFRDDLYYRLNVFEIKIPPVRERTADIVTLVHHLINRYNERYDLHRQISTRAMEVLLKYPWPGNCLLYTSTSYGNSDNRWSNRRSGSQRHIAGCCYGSRYQNPNTLLSSGSKSKGQLSNLRCGGRGTASFGPGLFYTCLLYTSTSRLFQMETGDFCRRRRSLWCTGAVYKTPSSSGRGKDVYKRQLVCSMKRTMMMSNWPNAA